MDDAEKNPKEVLKKAKVEDDEYKDVTGERNYYSIAHTIKETVTKQADMMVNGLLKEYQVKVQYVIFPSSLLMTSYFLLWYTVMD